MLENLNLTLFYWLNATPDSPSWLIDLAIYVAKDLITLLPLLAAALWLWGPHNRVSAQRQLVIKTAMALAVSMSLSWLIGHLFPPTGRLPSTRAIISYITRRTTPTPAITARWRLPSRWHFCSGIGSGLAARCWPSR